MAEREFGEGGVGGIGKKAAFLGGDFFSRTAVLARGSAGTMEIGND